MGSLNKVMLIGRLGKDPEIRYTPSGSAVANFSIATTDSWKDKQGQKQEKTEWHNIVAWDRLADLAQNYLKKGSQLYVEGRLQTRSWEDQQGQKKYTTEIIANTIQFLESKGSSESTGYASQSSGQDNRQDRGSKDSFGGPPMDGEDYTKDDIPF
ncbi:MAG: single-stranded DNA-binding protein [SAR324 cluster bacterium]|nr:single-stranded DNA-binding protein [SAR324 cluster bacterium]